MGNALAAAAAKTAQQHSFGSKPSALCLAIDVDLQSECRWAPPRVISQELREQAQQHLATIERYSAQPSSQAVDKWLRNLAPLLAGNNSAKDLELKLLAFSQMLDYPGYCYTPNSLREFARKQKFFPTFSELCEHLEQQKKISELEMDRCRAIVSPPTQKITERNRRDIPREQWTACDWCEFLSGWYRIMALKIGAPPSQRRGLAGDFAEAEKLGNEAAAKFGEAFQLDDDASKLREIVREELKNITIDEE